MTTTTDKYGFPLVPCGRCGGSGHHSYNLVHGTVCFGCGGSGFAVAPNARKAFNAFHLNFKAKAEPRVETLQVGDRVRPYYGNVDYRTVVSIEQTEDWCGSSRIGTGPVVDQYYVLVTLDDGETLRVHPGTLMRRRTTIADLEVPKFLAMVKPAKQSVTR